MIACVKMWTCETHQLHICVVRVRVECTGIVYSAEPAGVPGSSAVTPTCV